jgi:hypothetical protein
MAKGYCENNHNHRGLLILVLVITSRPVGDPPALPNEWGSLINCGRAVGFGGLPQKKATVTFPRQPGCLLSLDKTRRFPSPPSDEFGFVCWILRLAWCHFIVKVFLNLT